MKVREWSARYLSRRVLLKGIGMGAGLGALGGLSGCTQFLSRSEQGSSSLLASSKALGITERERKELVRQAYEVKEAWKEVLRDYYQWQKTGDESIKRSLPVKVQRAKQRALSLLDDPRFLSIAQKLDREIATVQVTPADKERLIRRMVHEWVSAGVPAEAIAQCEKSLRGMDLEIERKIITEAGGTATYVRLLMISIMAKVDLGYLGKGSLGHTELSFHEQAVSDPCLGLSVICTLLVASVLALFLASDDPLETLLAALALPAFAIFCGQGHPFSCPEKGESGGGEKPGDDEQLTP